MPLKERLTETGDIEKLGQFNSCNCSFLFLLVVTLLEDQALCACDINLSIF